VTLRPQVGVGDLEIHQTVSPGGRNIAPGTDYLYFEPGLVVLVALGFVYVGADANLMLLPFGPSQIDRNMFHGWSPSRAPSSALPLRRGLP